LASNPVLKNTQAIKSLRQAYNWLSQNLEDKTPSLLLWLCPGK